MLIWSSWNSNARALILKCVETRCSSGHKFENKDVTTHRSLPRFHMLWYFSNVMDKPGVPGILFSSSTNYEITMFILDHSLNMLSESLIARIASDMTPRLIFELLFGLRSMPSDNPKCHSVCTSNFCDREKRWDNGITTQPVVAWKCYNTRTIIMSQSNVSLGSNCQI